MDYANPDVLVSTDWVAQNLDNPNVRIFEVDEDVSLFDKGHIPGAQMLDWTEELQKPDMRDFISAEEFEKLMEEKGVSNDTTVVLYGDKSNWWAAYAFWFFKYNGHEDVRLMNGARQLWEQEGRPFTTETSSYPCGNYQVEARDESIRAFAPDVMKHLDKVQSGEGALIDVRSPREFSGELIAMPDYPQEGAQRGGHIPGAKNVPWAQAANEDGTFKSAEELEGLYAEKGLERDQEVVTYCRIAERSSHSWFVLKYLLGYPNVRNYDGSWTEWGNMVGVPIARGEES